MITEGAEDPRKMWRKLQNRYASTSETAHNTLSRKLANKILEPGGNIVNFMGELDEKYNRLEAMGENTSDRSKIAKLLTSLPQEYDSAAAALRTSQSNESRSWHGVQDIMQDEHERLAIQRGNNRRRATGRRALYTKEERANVICHKCGKKGHIKKNWWSEDRTDKNETNDSKEEGETSKEKSKAKKAKGGKTKVLMTREEFQHARGKQDSSIIDSGASHHMVNTSDILTEVKSGPAHEIFTANGEILKDHLFGSLALHLQQDDSVRFCRT